MIIFLTIHIIIPLHELLINHILIILINLHVYSRQWKILSKVKKVDSDEWHSLTHT